MDTENPQTILMNGSMAQVALRVIAVYQEADNAVNQMSNATQRGWRLTWATGHPSPVWVKTRKENHQMANNDEKQINELRLDCIQLLEALGAEGQLHALDKIHKMEQALKLVLALNRMPIDRCGEKIGGKTPYVVGYPIDKFRVDLDPKAEEQIREALK